MQSEPNNFRFGATKIAAGVALGVWSQNDPGLYKLSERISQAW
jgi:hypothetical protein